MIRTSSPTPLSALTSSSDLVYFFEIASTLNFSRAAERLGVTQPSLSQSIQKLEHSLGEKIFVRHKRGVTLTPAGKQLLVHTRSLLQMWEDVRSKTKSSMKEIKGTFTIGCHPSVALYALPSFLPKALENPHLEINLVHDLSRNITEQVISSQIDIGIVVNPVRHPDLVIQKLYDDEVTLWHNLSPAKLKLMDKSGYTIISEPSLLQTQSLMKKISAAKLPVSRTLQTSNLEVATSLTAAGCGIGILPTRVAQQFSKKLTRLENAPSYKDEICLAVRVESKNVAAIRYLCDQIKRSSKS